jgi:hypothetical protein
VWQGLQQSWSKAKANMVIKEPQSEEAKQELSLWTPAFFHKEKWRVGCTSNANNGLRQLGIQQYKDVVDPEGNIIKWQEKADAGFPERYRRAYEKLCKNIDCTRVIPSQDLEKIFIMAGPIQEGSLCWEVTIPKCKVRDFWQAGDLQVEPAPTYQLRGQVLCKQEKTPLPRGDIFGVIVRRPKGRQKKTLSLVGPCQSGQGIMDNFMWADKANLTCSSTGQICKLLGRRKF